MQLLCVYQFSSVTWSCLTLCKSIQACQASLSITNSWSLPRLMSVESLMPTISSSVIPFSSYLQSFPASMSFPMSQFFASGGQSIGASASASVLPMNIQGWFPFGLTGLVSRNNSGVCLIFSYMGLILIWCLCSWLPHPCVIDTRKCMYTHGGFMSMYGKTNTIL